MVAPLHLVLPESLRGFVDEQVRRGGFASADDYIQKLLTAEQRRVAVQKLEALAIEGLDSGDPVPLAADWKDRVRREAAARRDSRG